MKSLSKNDLRVLAIAYVSFIGLGLVGGLLGVAWESIRKDFALSLDAVGLLLTANTIGYLTSSFYIGKIAYRLGVGRMFTIGTALIAVGLLGSALAPAWWIMIGLGFLASLGTGIVDAGFNAYMAAHYNTRLMNWMHACFGIGITISPLMVTAIISSGVSWRASYAVVAVVQVALLLAFIFTLTNWRSLVAGSAESHTQPDQRVSLTQTLKMPMVWFSVALFLVYVGVESTPGQWLNSLLTGSRGFSAEQAGIWVGMYWGSLTVGRLFFGWIAPHLSTLRLLRGCMIGTVLGALLLWWNPFVLGGYLGIMLLGFSQAPLFPMLILTTRDRVGDYHAPNAIGIQVAGAGLGQTFLPSLAGVLAKRTTLEIIPILIFAAAVLGITMHEISLARRVAPLEPAPATD